MSENLRNTADAGLELRVESGMEQVERLLMESVEGSRGLIDDLTSHLARAGGKRLRPLLTLIAGQLGAPHRAQSEEVIKAAASVELTHLASLYHDDVMDSAPSRRGVEAAQILWGNNNAILAGDILFSRASSLAADLGSDSVRWYAQTFERLCMGQLNETFGPKEGDDPVDFYLQVLADKTGSLVASAGFFGAVHSGAGKEVAEMLRDFGESVGVAFQIADDVIDIVSPAEVTGKTPGTDLLEGVDTMPVLLLRRHQANGDLDPEGARILEMLEGDLQDPEYLNEVVQALSAHTVIDETRALAQEWADKACRYLEPLPDSDAKDALEAFALLMVERAA